MGLGSEILEPDTTYSRPRILDTVVKAPDPGSGSATLFKITANQIRGKREKDTWQHIKQNIFEILQN
jgi:hypothetical protein